MWETWVWSLGWEDPLEEGNPIQYSYLENPHEQRNLAGYSPRDCKELDMTEWLSIAQQEMVILYSWVAETQSCKDAQNNRCYSLATNCTSFLSLHPHNSFLRQA